jgi:3-oxoacyl-[acyl-carrier-protein] synthase II
MRRVVVTGIGVVTSLGCELEKFWQNVLASKSGIARITAFDPSPFSSQIGGEVRDFVPTKYIDEREAKRMDRFCQFALACSELAIKDSALFDDANKIDPKRVGVVIGSGVGGFCEIEQTTRALLESGPRRISPFFIPKLMMNAASGQVAIKYGLRGPNFATASACASANHAMGMALDIIRYGKADIVLTGGSEAALTQLGLGGFCALKALSTRNDQPEKASRPFDRERDGFVLGEGAAVFVFEEYEHAKRRSAKIYAEVLGFGATDDGYHITAPLEDGSGAADSIRLALEDAKISPEQVSYINAHGTSTKLNDASETKAIKMVFGKDAYKIPISSTKSQIGHLLGGAAAVELAATILAIRDNVVPPTINYEFPDPECDLDYVPNEPRPHKVDFAISNSFGFGGHNAVIVVGKLK